jgi:hypothetical protein
VSAIKASVGDVFGVPIDETRLGYGQVVEAYGDSGGHFFVVVFRPAYVVGNSIAVAKLADAPIALFALTMDPLIRIGHWPIVGQTEVARERVAWPVHKVATAPGEYSLTDHAGAIHDRASHLQKEALPYQSVTAPIRVENAFKALHSVGLWIDAYAALLMP